MLRLCDHRRHLDLNGRRGVTPVNAPDAATLQLPQQQHRRDDDDDDSDDSGTGSERNECRR